MVIQVMQVMLTTLIWGNIAQNQIISKLHLTRGYLRVKFSLWCLFAYMKVKSIM
ncbi:hypothetical protein HMPREF0653_02093 [Prevotella disiens JCM 6334 = ATCC 29426]|uniref:Uncharacterized protein n=1 Tax=Prevotella disiens JCM 6334 = ATCC 29426 TaxID=1235811 RepID=A0ABN0NQ82_9BACT|nr:hypothetical protein HMPREF0653_02093 [Prevotella disiens JCM 6334 = ATCC 29426]